MIGLWLGWAFVIVVGTMYIGKVLQHVRRPPTPSGVVTRESNLERCYRLYKTGGAS